MCGLLLIKVLVFFPNTLINKRYGVGIICIIRSYLHNSLPIYLCLGTFLLCNLHTNGVVYDCVLSFIAWKDECASDKGHVLIIRSRWLF